MISKCLEQPWPSALQYQAKTHLDWDGRCCLNAKNSKGRTVLMECCNTASYGHRKRDQKLLKAFLALGEDVYAEDMHGRTAWSYCGLFSETMVALLRHWDVRHTNSHGEVFLYEILNPQTNDNYPPEHKVPAILRHALPKLWEAGVDMHAPTDSGLSLFVLIERHLGSDELIQNLWSTYEHERISRLSSGHTQEGVVAKSVPRL